MEEMPLGEAVAVNEEIIVRLIDNMVSDIQYAAQVVHWPNESPGTHEHKTLACMY